MAVNPRTVSGLAAALDTRGKGVARVNTTAHPDRKAVLKLAATALCIVTLASTRSVSRSCSAETAPGPGSTIAAGSGYSLLIGGGDAEYRATPGIVEGLSNIVAIDAGSLSCISLKADGTVWTWGYRSEFDGRGRSTYSRQPVPLAVDLPDRALSIEAGGSHYLAVLPGGEVWAWGSNYSNQVGQGPELYERPVRIQGLPPCAAVSAGDSFSLALDQDGSVWAWGANHSGQLGLGHMRRVAVPTKVERLNGIIAIAAGWDHALALGADGTVWELGAKRLLFPFDVTYNLLWPARVDTIESGVRLLP